MLGCDIDRKLCIEAALGKRLFIYAAAAKYSIENLTVSRSCVGFHFAAMQQLRRIRDFSYIQQLLRIETLKVSRSCVEFDFAAMQQLSIELETFHICSSY